MDLKNLSIIRQSFASTVFTHQVQEVAASNKRKKVFIIKLVNIVLVSLVLILLVLQTQYPQQLLFAYIASGLTVSEVIFLIIQLTFNFEQEGLLHKNSALKYMSLRDHYRLLITDIMNERTPKRELIARRNALQQEYQSISDLSPSTGEDEYVKAQKLLGLNGSGEQFTWTDKEIDRFLPEELHLVKVSARKSA